MNPTHDAIRQEAADWFARRRDGGHTPGEEAAFRAWRDRSEVHARVYAETERAWAQWASLRDSARMREMAAAAMSATAPRSRRVEPRRWRPLLAAACVALVAVAGGSWLLPRLKYAPAQVYRTGLGERRTEQLPDGTRVMLNTQTSLRVQYSRRQREVVLQRGEALFDVAHDAGHPFVVIAGGGRVTDLGTRFDVRDDDGKAAVTLLHGQVDVAVHDQHRALAPGEQARYGDGTAGIDVQRVDTTAVTNWLHGRLDFDGLPLAQAVAEANRYGAVKLRLGDPSLAALPVAGSFRAGDNAAIAAALSAVFPVRVARSDAHEIVLMPR